MSTRAEEDTPWFDRFPFTVRCPQCGAAAGLPCLDTRGWTTSPHTERKLRAAE